MSSDEGSAGEESFSSFTRPVNAQAFLDSLARNSEQRSSARAGAKPRSSPPKFMGSHSASSAPYISSSSFTAGLHTPMSSAMKDKERQLEAQAQQAGYFASSSFQNSPSPEDLPDPSLI